MSETKTHTELVLDAIAERDRILTAMDTEAAKAFVVKHGGSAGARIDWTIVLHLARWEVTTIADDLKWESRIFLARSGHYGITQMPMGSPYVRAALDLIFPRKLTDETIRLMDAAS